MKLPSFFGGATVDEEAPVPGNSFIAPDEVAVRTPDEKIKFHIDRFTRAIQQCDKGPDRVAELQANLDYWINVQNLSAARGGLK